MNVKNPLFTVVIPTYNRAAELQRALQSLVEQRYKNFEVIVSDDGSTDNIGEIVLKYSEKLDLNFLSAIHWGGPARPRNAAINVARGEWIAFLDSDDWWYAHKLYRVHAIIRNEESDLIYHDLDFHTDEGKCRFRKFRGRNFKIPVFKDLLLGGNAIANSSVVVRRKIINKVGGICEDSNFIAVEDVDLWLKISKISDRFYYISESLGAYWYGGGNISSFNRSSLEKLDNIYKKHIKLLASEDKVKALKMRDYTKARILQSIGHYEEALGLFKKVVGVNKIEYKIKAIVFGTLCLIKYLFQKILNVR